LVFLSMKKENGLKIENCLES